MWSDIIMRVKFRNAKQTQKSPNVNVIQYIYVRFSLLSTYQTNIE